MSLIATVSKLDHPRSFDSTQAVFRFTDELPSRNYGLLDVGIQSYSGGADRHFSSGAGAFSNISRMFLTDLNTGNIVCMYDRAAYSATYETVKKSGNANYSMGSAMTGTSLQYDFSDVISVDTTSPALGNNTPLSYIDLGRYLPLLYAMTKDKYTELHKAIKSGNRRRERRAIANAGVLRTDVMKLELTIQYSQDPASFLFKNGQPGDSYVIKPPLLRYDICKFDGKLDPKFDIFYDEYLTEQVTIPAIARAGDVQTIENQRLQGADGLFLKRLVAMKCGQPGANRNEAWKSFGSEAMFDEEINFEVNYAQLLPVSANSPARLQTYLDMINPAAMCPILSNVCAHGATEPDQLYGADDTDAYYGRNQFSYVGFDINQQISHLSFRYVRKGLATAGAMAPILMTFLYTVARVYSS